MRIGGCISDASGLFGFTVASAIASASAIIAIAAGAASLTPPCSPLVTQMATLETELKAKGPDGKPGRRIGGQWPPDARLMASDAVTLKLQYDELAGKSLGVLYCPHFMSASTAETLPLLIAAIERQAVPLREAAVGAPNRTAQAAVDLKAEMKTKLEAAIEGISLQVHGSSCDSQVSDAGESVRILGCPLLLHGGSLLRLSTRALPPTVARRPSLSPIVFVSDRACL